ncbi:hypothetical protein J8I29_26155 [Labrys sp. LIt4]|uniref:hypothetical protein n=1 Tax=Labrys TaxID=204476 RepID=UPI0015E470A9|nr:MULTISPECIES: hypothetical protein [Labrys]MBP0582837.1 hypothetical protein [Labrys sp. LIt4]
MPTEQTREEESKDRFFQKLEDLAREMIDTHDKDFAMGALILTARWIAEERIAKIAQAS